YASRGVTEADTEIAVQGSKEAFSESLRTNTVLLRRRIRDTNLKLKHFKIGKRSKTDIVISYIDDIVRQEILLELEHRLCAIDIDSILDSGYIEQLTEDSPYSPFPQMQLTERPDKAAAALLDGRIAIIVDNTPFVIILPSTFSSFYQASEDYYQRWEIMSFVRILRYIAGFLAVALPGFYLAAATFHPSMIPMELMFRMSSARESVPLPAVLEVLLMELAFETLREAGIRLPSAIGSTLGIVGGIIIGQAAVDAGLVSPIVVIIISVTAICSFAIPNIALVSAYRLTKYFVILMSASFGLYGFCLAMLFILSHLSSLTSFGIPYMYPFTSSPDADDKTLYNDTFFRLPIFRNTRRSIFAADNQKIKQRSPRNF
ncbi:MAG: spore germination protein, partial [Firmicutes bacterium]|nr:spore germination protein [Bacillota bacterium]